jgi:Cytochrome C and Quinol oxidase polypeptide I
MTPAPVPTAPRSSGFVPDGRLAGAYVAVGLVALFGGMVTGLLQALTLAGVHIPAHFLVQSYYHSVSLHGVLNVLVWTTFFIGGFVPFIALRSLGTPLVHALGWATFWVMITGLVLAAIPVVANTATVMFTFYPPLKAPWAFYVGLTLVVAGTLNLTLTWRRWRATHPDARTPLAAFMSLITFVMWTIASLGLAAEMLFLLIPWSLAWSEPRTRSLPARCSGSRGTLSCTSGCFPRTSPGTRWCRARQAVSSSAIRWPGHRSSCSWCCRRHSACTISLPIPVSTRAGSWSTPS